MNRKDRLTVAVIGAGASGLSMLKTLREDGFATTLFERRGQVGGLWAYTDDITMTSALPTTIANISKYTCGFSDYPMPDKYPPFMTPSDFQEYMESYAKAFDMHKDIVFNAFVKKVMRNSDGTKWIVEMSISGTDDAREFDKVVLCHGYQTKPVIPEFEGRERFTGEFIHSVAYQKPESYKGKNVLIVGFSATASDIIPQLVLHANKVYASHRRGTYIFTRWLNGLPIDLGISWSRRKMGYFLQRYFPALTDKLADLVISYLIKKRYKGKIDPAWGLDNPRPVLLSLSNLDESILDLLAEGKVISKPGIARFLGPKEVGFTDGTVLNNIDAIICCTGYTADFSITPFLEHSAPERDLNGRPYGGPPIPRMYMNIFPPAHADSIAILAYSLFGKSNGFSFSDVTSMAVSNIWRGVSADMLPPRSVMEHAVDTHHAWVATRWQLDHTTSVAQVRPWEFQGFLHEAAGTGMENLGWGWKGWWFWLREPKMSRLMNHGVETAHAFRFFETGKRKTWLGAREAIIHMNELVKEIPKK